MHRGICHRPKKGRKTTSDALQSSKVNQPQVERAVSPTLLLFLILLVIVGWIGQNQVKRFWCDNWLTKPKNWCSIVSYPQLFLMFLLFLLVSRRQNMNKIIDL